MSRNLGTPLNNHRHLDSELEVSETRQLETHVISSPLHSDLPFGATIDNFDRIKLKNSSFKFNQDPALRKSKANFRNPNFWRQPHDSPIPRNGSAVLRRKVHIPSQYFELPRIEDENEESEVIIRAHHINRKTFDDNNDGLNKKGFIPLTEKEDADHLANSFFDIYWSSRDKTTNDKTRQRQSQTKSSGQIKNQKVDTKKLQEGGNSAATTSAIHNQKNRFSSKRTKQDKNEDVNIISESKFQTFQAQTGFSSYSNSSKFENTQSFNRSPPFSNLKNEVSPSNHSLSERNSSAEIKLQETSQDYFSTKPKPQMININLPSSIIEFEDLRSYLPPPSKKISNEYLPPSAIPDKFSPHSSTIERKVIERYFPSFQYSKENAINGYIPPHISSKPIVTDSYNSLSTTTERIVDAFISNSSTFLYLPNSKPNVENNYFPPVKTPKPKLAHNYIPPPSFVKSKVVATYLNPFTTSTPSFANSYLPPTTSVPEVVKSYISPSTTLRAKLINSYLPPKTSDQKIALNYLYPSTTPITKVVRNYLPPSTISRTKENKTHLFTATLTELADNNVLSSTISEPRISGNYLPPPTTPGPKESSLYLLPTATSEHKVVNNYISPSPTPKPSVVNNYLPPSTTQTTNLGDIYISPLTTFEDEVVESYLPPAIFSETKFAKSYFPPSTTPRAKEEPNITDHYLPPHTTFKPKVISRPSTPPKPRLVNRYVSLSTISRPEVVNNYIPPSTTAEPRNIDSYLPPPTVLKPKLVDLYSPPLSDTKHLQSDKYLNLARQKVSSTVSNNYFSPVQTHTVPQVDSRYLPPKNTDDHNTAKSSKEFIIPVVAVIGNKKVNYKVPVSLKELENTTPNSFATASVDDSLEWSSYSDYSRNDFFVDNQPANVLPISNKKTDEPLSLTRKRKGGSQSIFVSKEIMRANDNTNKEFSFERKPYSLISRFDPNASDLSHESHEIHSLTKCSSNSECDYSDICLEGVCTDACVIAIGRCVGNSTCRTVRHVPSCLCPASHTSITLREHGIETYDCMPMALVQFPKVSTAKSIKVHAFQNEESSSTSVHCKVKLRSTPSILRMFYPLDPTSQLSSDYMFYF